MLTDILGNVWGTMVSIIVYFFLIFFLVFSVESNLNTNIKDKTAKFVNESCMSGKLDANTFLTYERNIFKYGKYDIDIKIDKVRAYPSMDANGNASARMGYDTYSTDDVMDAMYPADYKVNGRWVHPAYQDYELNAGDTITVTVVRQKSISSGIYKALFNRDNNNTVITRYHNVVGYSYGT